MNIKDNISPAERILFVDSVFSMCKIKDKYEPAIYDYAFRINIITFFTDIDLINKTQEELTNIAYSQDCNKILSEESTRKYVILSLDKACKEKIKIEQDKIMCIYQAMAYNDPIRKIAEVVDEFLKNINDQINIDQIVDTIVDKRKIDYDKLSDLVKKKE